MLLTFLLAVALWNSNCWWNAANIYTFAVQPGYLDFDNLPDTNFSCDGKVIGGYYADVETGCQMFHVCTIGQKAEITDIKFLCLNGTVFDQETRVCERLDEVDCSKSESFFDLNLELYGNNGAGYGIAPEEPPEQEPVQCNADGDDCSGTSDYFDEATTVASIKSTAVPVTTTTTTTTITSTTSTTTARTTTSTIAAGARKPPAVTTTAGTTRPPPVISYPTNSPETIAALIALHNAFQESLKEREQGPGPKGQRYPPPIVLQQQQQQQPKPFTVANFQPPRHFPSKVPPPPPPYRHQLQQQQQQQLPPVLLSSERFGNQNFRHGFRLQNAPPPVDDSPPVVPPPRPPYHQQQQQQYTADDAQYDGSYEDGAAAARAAEPDDEEEDEESRRNFARETSEASVSVSVQVSSSSSSSSSLKNSAIDQQQRERPATTASATVDEDDDDDDDAAAAAARRVPYAPQTPAPTVTTSQQPPPPPAAADDDADGELYEDEYEELEADEEFFKDVPKLGRNKRRKRNVTGGRRRA